MHAFIKKQMSESRFFSQLNQLPLYQSIQRPRKKKGLDGCDNHSCHARKSSNTSTNTITNTHSNTNLNAPHQILKSPLDPPPKKTNQEHNDDSTWIQEPYLQKSTRILNSRAVGPQGRLCACAPVRMCAWAPLRLCA